MTDEVAKAEGTLASLRQKRDALIARGVELGEERTQLAFAAHASDDVKARKRLDEINREAALHDSELRSIDAAISEATKRATAAQAAEATAADRQRAGEAQKLVDELAEVFVYTDKYLQAALKGFLAIERGTTELHQKGVAFPTDVQLRLGAVAVIATWLQQLPRMWFNEIAGGVRYLAPGERKTALSYFAQLEPSLRNAIRQRLGEAERTDTEAA